MVSSNLKYLGTLPALLKMVTLLLGIISIGLAGHAYENSLYNIFWALLRVLSWDGIVEEDMDSGSGLGRETFFIGVSSFMLIVSSISLLCHILNEELAQTSTCKSVDIGIHVIGALLLIIGGSLLIASAAHIDDMCKKFHHEYLQSNDTSTIIPPGIELLVFKNCQLGSEKIAAGVFGILNFFPHGFVALVGVLRYNSDGSFP